MSAPDCSFLIVCGAEKCGTTSLFTYLSAHPQVCASSKKETDFFRGDVANLSAYLDYFDLRRDAGSLRVESSPGYMAEAQQVAPRIAALLPQARCLFILRDPIDRLRSSFRFYKSRLHLPGTMDFEQFVNVCFDHEDGHVAESPLGIKPWHLRSLSRGRYERQLGQFGKHIPGDQQLILLYDDLRDDMRAAMARVCAFAGISASFYDDRSFARENVSFLAEHHSIQRVAIFVNDRFEAVWRRHPSLKRKLLGAYKRFNERPLERDVLGRETEDRLRTWYAPTYALLHQLRPQTPAATQGTAPLPAV